MIKENILIVDDEPQIRKLIAIVLEDENYQTFQCESGTQAIKQIASIKPNLVILDLGLPDMDGKEVIKNIQSWSNTPIIVCSVRDSDDEVVAALNLGANDYITKPFNPDILVARVKANLRKSITEKFGEPNLKNGQIEINLEKHEIKIKGKKQDFTPKEYELLKYLMAHKGKMVTHSQILKEVWGPAHGQDTQYLRVYISQVREKIEPDPKNPIYIVTESGIGYRMEIIDHQ